MWTAVKKKKICIIFLSSLSFPASIYWGKRKQTKPKQKPTKPQPQTLHSVVVHRNEPPIAELALGRSNTKPSSIATRMFGLHSSSLHTCLGVAFWYTPYHSLTALRQGSVIKPSYTPCWVLQELESFLHTALKINMHTLMLRLAHRANYRRLLIKISTSKARQGVCVCGIPFTPALI